VAFFPGPRDGHKIGKKNPIEIEQDKRRIYAG
jgi:hypothetical protein